MTHARSPHTPSPHTSSPLAATPPAGSLPAAAARGGRRSAATPAARDAAALAERRQLADSLDLPGTCPREACRRARCCRGPRGTTAAFPGEVLPDCLASGFEELYRPVARWRSLMEAIAAAEARLARPGPA